MNFVRLVENGTYSKEKLSKENKAVIDGMDEIIRQVEEYEPEEIDIFGNGSEEMIGKMIKEIQFGTLEELATMLLSLIHI